MKKRTYILAAAAALALAAVAAPVTSAVFDDDSVGVDHHAHIAAAPVAAGPSTDGLSDELAPRFLALGLSDEANAALLQSQKNARNVEACFLKEGFDVNGPAPAEGVEERAQKACWSLIETNEDHLGSAAYRQFQAEMEPIVTAAWTCTEREAGLEPGTLLVKGNYQPSDAETAERLQAATAVCFDETGLPRPLNG
jgi:hypothetical protein